MAKKPMLLFPGCALDGAAREYGLSTEAVLKLLDTPIETLEDWNCCGAAAARSVDPELSIRLCQRNLDLAAAQGADLMVVCAACYNNLAHAAHVLKQRASAEPPQGGKTSRRDEPGQVHHLLTYLSSEEMMERIREHVSTRLEGMSLACYYGCLLVRPGEYTRLDDPENPRVMENLMELCGARTVDWSYKTDCCGASFSVTHKPTAVELMSRIFDSALEQGATALVTACPLCQMNLDAWQRDVGKAMGRKLTVPVYYFTELLAVAMDVPKASKWLKGHLTKAGIALGKTR